MPIKKKTAVIPEMSALYKNTPAVGFGRVWFGIGDPETASWLKADEGVVRPLASAGEHLPPPPPPPAAPEPDEVVEAPGSRKEADFRCIGREW